MRSSYGDLVVMTLVTESHETERAEDQSGDEKLHGRAVDRGFGEEETTKREREELDEASELQDGRKNRANGQVLPASTKLTETFFA